MRRLLIVFLLVACAQIEVKPPAGALEFDLSGRIAARYGDDAFSGLLTWRHAADGDEMLISTPMGQGVARIVRDADGVVLRTAEPREYRAADAESLTQQVLGFRLPLAGLGDWVRARPADGPPFQVERSPEGRLRVLEQLGWRVEYQEYEGDRPKRMRLVYPGVDLRFVVTEWK